MSTAAAFLLRWWLFGVAALLAGCSTPQPILNLAGQGSATVGLAEASLRDYLKTTNAQLIARTDLMRVQAQNEVRSASQREFELFLATKAGMEQSNDVAAMIQALADERRRLREKVSEEAATREKQFSLDAAALPQVPAEKLAAARKGFEVLAQELTPQEWLELATAYAREIKTGIDKLRAPKP